MPPCEFFNRCQVAEVGMENDQLSALDTGNVCSTDLTRERRLSNSCREIFSPFLAASLYEIYMAYTSSQQSLAKRLNASSLSPTA